MNTDWFSFHLRFGVENLYHLRNCATSGNDYSRCVEVKNEQGNNRSTSLSHGLDSAQLASAFYRCPRIYVWYFSHEWGALEKKITLFLYIENTIDDMPQTVHGVRL